MTGNLPLSIYIHIPFCHYKCHYCSFYTIPYHKGLLDKYLHAVVQEGLIKLYPLRQSHQIVSLYLGGGTPSILSPDQIDMLLSHFGPTQGEITLECNPDDLTPQYLRSLASTRINRLSVGAQTFNPRILASLGRQHSPDQIIRSIQDAYQLEFKNLSIDLIYELPKQTIGDFHHDLSIALNLPISHISCYNLTIDPHTVFYKYRSHISRSLPSQESSVQMTKLAKKLCEMYQFHQYELGSYAKPGYASQHNMGYWTGREFLGLGVSASEYIHHRRAKNIAHIHKYIRAIQHHGSAEEFNETLPPYERIKEALALQLRLTCGANTQDFPKELIHQLLNNPKVNHLLSLEGSYMKLSDEGLLFHDSVAEEIMSL